MLSTAKSKPVGLSLTMVKLVRKLQGAERCHLMHHRQPTHRTRTSNQGSARFRNATWTYNAHVGEVAWTQVANSLRFNPS